MIARSRFIYPCVSEFWSSNTPLLNFQCSLCFLTAPLSSNISFFCRNNSHKRSCLVVNMSEKPYTVESRGTNSQVSSYAFPRNSHILRLRKYVVLTTG